MKTTTYLLAFLLFPCLTIWSQRPEADVISTKKGDLKVQPVLHGTLVLRYDNKTIYVDPYGGATAFLNCQNPISY